VLSIDAKRVGKRWHAFSHGGRYDTGRDVVKWAIEGERLGAGEILLNSIDADGTGAGYDIELTRAVSESVGIPVIASGGAGSLEQIYKVFEEGGADGVVAINTVKGMRIDVFSRKPVLSNISGGVSGEAIKPIAIKCVWDLYEELDVPVIGAGGITTWKDVVEFMLAGATAVQIGSALFYSYRIFYSVRESLIAYTRLMGEKLSDIVGKAHG
jgi:dihydroorotate dehydrogenase (NAD+) catalytic subunit